MAISTPAVPASTVPATNDTGQYLNVNITGGTLTFVFVNGAQVGTTAGNYTVPPGGTISITYSVAPTWTWTSANTSGSYLPGYAGSNSRLTNELGDFRIPVHAEGGVTGLAALVTN